MALTNKEVVKWQSTNQYGEQQMGQPDENRWLGKKRMRQPITDVVE
jgi:hypothetical protein